MTHSVSCRQLLDVGSLALERAGNATSRLDAALLLAHQLRVSRESLLMNLDKVLDNNDEKDFLALILRRVRHEPLAYITGQKEFWSLDFYVTRDTLIPRPDSETLIEATLKRVKNRASDTTILDLGTGTGCLVIALLKELPKANGVGVDINERALQVAQANAARHEVGDRVVFLQSDWCDALNGTFDLILANPPYIAEADRGLLMQDVVQYEPHTALFAGHDGLDAYRLLAPQVASRLNKGGMVCMEVGQHQAQEVNALLRAQGLLVESPHMDLAGIARCVIAYKSQ